MAPIGAISHQRELKPDGEVARDRHALAANRSYLASARIETMPSVNGPKLIPNRSYLASARIETFVVEEAL